MPIVNYKGYSLCQQCEKFPNFFIKNIDRDEKETMFVLECDCKTTPCKHTLKEAEKCWNEKTYVQSATKAFDDAEKETPFIPFHRPIHAL